MTAAKPKPRRGRPPAPGRTIAKPGKRPYLMLFEGHERGEVKAHPVHRFTFMGMAIDVIRPGYDIQGVKQMNWTQFVHQGVPIAEGKRLPFDNDAIEKWLRKRAEGLTKEELKAGIADCKATRLKHWRDEIKGVEPVPAYRIDGQAGGEDYPD